LPAKPNFSSAARVGGELMLLELNQEFTSIVSVSPGWKSEPAPSTFAWGGVVGVGVGGASPVAMNGLNDVETIEPSRVASAQSQYCPWANCPGQLKFTTTVLPTTSLVVSVD